MRACFTHARAFRASGKGSPACEPTGVVTFVQAMLLAVLQGVSELFPVSSLGHTVLLPALLRWGVDEGSDSFLAFVVVLHLGTALALIVFYREDWIAIVRAFVASDRARPDRRRPRRAHRVAARRGDDPGRRARRVARVEREEALRFTDARLAVPVRERLHHAARRVAAAPPASAATPAPGSGSTRRIEKLHQLSGTDGVIVGFAQSLALLPGISRSGSAIVAGLLRDLRHEDAARYSFLLATPVILAASVLEFPKLFAPDAHVVLVQARRRRRRSPASRRTPRSRSSRAISATTISRRSRGTASRPAPSRSSSSLRK